MALPKAERDLPNEWDSPSVVDIHIKSLSPAQKSANSKIAYQGIFCDVLFGWPCQRPNEIHQTSGTPNHSLGHISKADLQLKSQPIMR